jgi:hypothetical protein
MTDISVGIGTALINATSTWLNRNPLVDHLPVIQIKLAFNPAPTREKPHVSARLNVSRPVRASQALENVLRMDTKSKGQIAYMAALSVTNRTWGKLDEVIDMAEVLVDSLLVDGVPLTEVPDWALLVNPWTKMQAIWQLGVQGRIELDTQKFMQGMMAEIITDLAIGYLSQAELHMMRNLFPPNHPLMNVYGMPTTWARRMGYDPLGGMIKPIGSAIRGSY